MKPDPWPSALADPAFHAAMAAGRADIAAGRVRPWREVRAEMLAAEPQPEPPAPVEPPADDEVPDEPVEEPATPEEGD